MGVYCGGLAPPEFAILCKMDVRPDDPAGPARGWPIVVDLDGTLTPVDTLAESLVARVRNAPGTLFLAPLWVVRGRAGFKQAIADGSRFSVVRLPYRDALLDYLREARAEGRRIVLATAAHRSIALAVASHLDCFDDVIATDGHNLKGRAKLEAIVARVGVEFSYAGDSAADLPIWEAASGAILVGTSSRVAARVRRTTPVEMEIPREPAGLRVWLRALRVHQWLKNLLLFVPLLTAFAFTDVKTLLVAFTAFLAFSLAASATYIVNDIFDLESDRAHPRKRYRPFACGQISMARGLAMSCVLLACALALSLVVSTGFTLILLTYLLLTSLYSWTLKRYVLLDVIALSSLYTLRILAGSIAVGVATSSWLLSFSMFMFLSLALVKRCAELLSLKQSGLSASRGRDYGVSDLDVLWPLGVGAALSAVVVFGLFISAPETQARYATPQLLWIVAIGLVYWLARMWIKTSRGEMHDDPVIYALRDRGSRVTVFAMVATQLAAHFLELAWWDR